MTITGYMTADESGRDATLSLQRAQHARQLLVANGVPAGQIDAVDGGVVDTLTGGRNGLDPNQSGRCRDRGLTGLSHAM